MRSYEQHCALAKSLDVVGDRWSLLIVRELLAGQSRWHEIRDGLPGIAKNLLAQRLRTLEDEGVIAHEGDHYLLTERGRALEPVLRAMAIWGAPRLPGAPATEKFRARWLALVARALPDTEVLELDERHAALRVGDTELRGTPRGVADRLAQLQPS